MSTPTPKKQELIAQLIAAFRASGNQDAAFDKQAQLRSVPAALGVKGALRLAAICHLVTLLLLFALPLLCPQVPLRWIYISGVAIVAALLIYEHLLVRPNDLTRVNIAFFNINAVISLGVFVVGTIDLLIKH